MDKMYSGKITHIYPGSLAEELELVSTVPVVNGLLKFTLIISISDLVCFLILKMQ